MNDFLIFVVASLACFRASLLLSEEEGPFAIFARMRKAVPAKTNPGRGIRCPWCWSVWCAFAITAALTYLGHVPLPLAPLYAFAISGVAVLLHKLV